MGNPDGKKASVGGTKCWGFLHEMYSIVMESLLEMLPREENRDWPTFPRTQTCVKGPPHTRPTCVEDAMPLDAPAHFTSWHNNTTHH